METKRLRALQVAPHLERLLEACITRSDLVPKNSYQIRDPNGVGVPLRRIAMRAIDEGRVWSCWACGAQLWLFTAEMSLQLSRERGAPVLSVNRYGEDGELMEAGVWLLNLDGFWQRSSE